MKFTGYTPSITVPMIYYERSFLIVLHNVWSTGPGKAADLIFES